MKHTMIKIVFLFETDALLFTKSLSQLLRMFYSFWFALLFLTITVKEFLAIKLWIC